MAEISQAFRLALQLVVSLDRDLFEIVFLSLQVSLTSVIIACVIGMPMGALLGITRFPGRRASFH